jgi:REP element-mobilizing transposase RayT
VASCLIAIIARGTDELHQFQLHAYVIMPNHVHLLITPAVSVTRIMRGIKGISAREANRILSRGGKAFWQDESYDHWVRSEQEFGRIRTYIEMNPVSVGLAKKAEEWPWTSAGKIAW